MRICTKSLCKTKTARLFMYKICRIGPQTVLNKMVHKIGGSLALKI